MSKHTPGPWEVDELEHSLVRSSDRYPITNTFRHFRDKSECHANARLIAAAPETAAERDHLKALNAEMLEVLQGFRRIGESDVPLAEMQSEIVELRNKAEAAIAKGEWKHRFWRC